MFSRMHVEVVMRYYKVWFININNLDFLDNCFIFLTRSYSLVMANTTSVPRRSIRYSGCILPIFVYSIVIKFHQYFDCIRYKKNEVFSIIP